MTEHALFDLAVDREVKKVTGFRKMAQEMTGDQLRELFGRQKESAPKLREAEKKYFGEHTGELANAPKTDRDEHLVVALHNYCKDNGALELPDGTSLDLFDYQVGLRTDKDDKNVKPIDLLGITDEGRLAVVVLKFVPPQATRGTTGETPLRAVLEGLAQCAAIEANRADIIADAKSELDRDVADETPLILIAANLRYWELCRKRDAQSGAAWINQIERLAKEVEVASGVEIRFLGIELSGDPGWITAETRPELQGEPEVLTAWEPGAGRPKPKRARRDSANEIVEADPSRPTRKYEMIEIFTSGDTIDHHTLGKGVVQRSLGPLKIEVLFDGQRKVLVHGREPVGQPASAD